MIFLKRLLLETNEDGLSISIEDVQNLVSSRYLDWNTKSTLSVLEDFYFDEDPKKQQYAKDYLELLNRVLSHGIKIAQGLNVPHVNLRMLKSYLLYQQEFKTKVEEFFPFPLYISATRNMDGDWAEIGIMVDINGKVLEVHEGNDEASPETNTLANKLVNPIGKPIRIYAAHDTNLVHKIDETGYLPANLYVSPHKEHALSYLDLEGKRTAFTGIIDSNAVAHESELDWRTLETTKIEKFRWI